MPEHASSAMQIRPREPNAAFTAANATSRFVADPAELTSQESDTFRPGLKLLVAEA
jgi:Na+-transporting NADH:ubiquinone oxidoreductase subunit NqrA